MKHLTIGKLAAHTGVGVETIRYYERSGFLPAPDRLPSGYRVYGKDTVNKVRFIREAQSLGFSLAEISDLLSLTDDPQADCAQVNARAQTKLDEIEDKIQRLRLMQASLKRLAEYCPADEQPLSECSIINHLYGKDTDHDA
jgi:MerR family mercuric resistance operon transcriptional regulator